MTDQIFFDGKRYISAHDAAESSSVTRDYIARLCRDTKVRGRRIGKNWYVEEQSLKQFLVEQEYQKALRNETLAKQREVEYQKSNPAYVRQAPVQPVRVAAAVSIAAMPSREVVEKAAVLTPVYEKLAHVVAQQSGRALERAGDLVNAPSGIADAAIRVAHVPTYAISPVGEFVHKLVALTLAVMLTFGTYALVDPKAGALALNGVRDAGAAVADVYKDMKSGGVTRIASNVKVQVAAAASNPGAAFGGIPEFFKTIARSFNAQVDSFVYAIAFPQQLTRSSGSVAIEIQPYAKPQQTPTPSSPPVAVSAPVTQIVKTVQQPIVTERIVQMGGISEAELNDRLNQLSNKLVAQIYGITSAPSSLPASGGYTNNIALTQRIDNLSGVDITNSTFSGGSISNTSIDATSLGVSGNTTLATTTVNGDLTVNGSVAMQNISLSSTTVTINGTSGQTANFLDIKDSNGTTVFAVQPDGTLISNISSTTQSVSQLLVTGNATATNMVILQTASTTNLLAENATTTNFFATTAHFLSTAIDSFSATLASITGLTVTNSTTTNATTTNFFAENASTTNATSTNFFSVNASTTNATSTNLFAATAHFLSSVIDSFSAAVASITSLTATNATTTNLAATNFTSFTAPIAPYFVATSSSATSTFAGGFSVGTDQFLVQQATGNVGIGTANPVTNLEVAGTGSADILLRDNSQGGDLKSYLLRNSSANFYIGRSTDTFGSFTPYLTLQNGGNVGIGTTSPFAKFSVNGSGFFDGDVTATNITATGTLSAASLSGASVSSLTANYLGKWNSGTWANSIIFDNGTQLGIGTNSNLSGAVTANGTFGVQAEGDIFRQYDSADATWYPIIARYNSNNGTYPASTYIFGNGANAKVAFEVPGGTNLTTFQVRANNSTFNGNVTLSNLSANTLLYTNASKQVTSGSVGSSLTFSSGTLSLNTANANTWSALQQFANATTTLFSATQKAYFGTSGQSSFDFNGVLTLGTPLANGSGGTGITSYTAGDILYADGSGVLQKLPIGADGSQLLVAAGLPSWGSAGGGGGSGANDVWATTTNDQVIYPTNTTRSVVIGTNATTTTNSIFEVFGQQYISSKLAIATTSPSSAQLSVSGSGYFTAGLGIGVLNTAAGTLQTSGDATIGGTVLLPGLSTNSLLYTNGVNQVAAAAVDSSLVFSSGTLSLNTANTNTFSALQNFGAGLTAYASSTIGDGTQAGGLTVSGGATTTGNQYVAGQLLLASGSVTFPSYSFFDDADTGIYSNGANSFALVSGGSRRFSLTNNGLLADNAAGAQIANGATSGTAPSLIPNRADSTTGVGANASGVLSFITNALERMTITNSGNVGVGTSTPWAKLALTGTSGQTNPLFQVASSTNSPFFTITSSGSVGIGTDNPFFPLDINATQASLHLKSTNTANASYLQLDTDVSNSAYFGVSKSAGNFTGWGEAAGALFWGTGAPKPIQLATNGEIRTTIDSSGNVGIGTTSPFAKLSVNGDGFFAGNVTGTNFTATGTLAVTGLTTLGNASTTQLSASGALYTPVTSSLVTTGADGKVAAYAGSSCTNQFVRSLNGAGVATCATVSLTADVTGVLAIANGGTNTNSQTSNGVAYFDGTKITTGTGFIFDGTNVGIGTTTPGYQLTLGANSSGDSDLSFNRTLNSDYALLRFSTGGTADWVVGQRATSDSDFHVYSAGTAADVLTIARTTGNVGIGTTTPWKALSISTTGAADGAIITNSAAGSGATFDLESTDTGGNRWRFQSLGNIANRVGNLEIADMSNGASLLTLQKTTGNIGIGTTTPFRKLSVTDTVAAAQVAIAYDASRYAQMQVDSSGDFHINPSGGDVQQDDSNLFVCAGGSCPTGTPSGTGNLIVESKLGIGTSTPSYNLDIVSSGNGTQAHFGNTADGGAYILSLAADSGYFSTGAAYNGTNWIAKATTATIIGAASGAVTTYTNTGLTPGSSFSATARTTLTSGGFFGVGTTSPAQQLATAGLVFVGANGATGMGTATSTFYGDIKINGKLDVGTIDPPYTIDGTKYATFVPSMTGVKEETAQAVQLTEKTADGKYAYTIDFDREAKGSDLWLFYQVTDLGTTWQNLTVLLTPSFEGSVYYKKLPGEHKLTVYADQPGEVSMRLTGNRYDFTKWPNLRKDQDGNTEGTHVISSKPKAGSIE